MKKRENVDYAIIVIILIIAICGLSLSCLALSNSFKMLKMQGVAEVKSSDWDVHFENLSTIEYEGTAIGIITPTIKDNSTIISLFKVEFNDKDDSVLYKLDVVNNSSVDAKIASMTKTIPECYGLYENALKDASLVCKNFKYKLTYEDGTDVNIGDSLDSNSSITLKLSMWYDGNEWPINTVQVENLSIQLYYVQK